MRQVCDTFDLYVAIDNGPLSCVVGGAMDRLLALEQECLLLGANCTRLRVQVASHTPLMTDARLLFQEKLEGIAMQRPTLSVLANATAERVRDVGQAKCTLAAQIDQTLRWSECMETIRARGVRCVLEVGPGHALARLWNQRYTDVPARSVDEFRNGRGVIDWMFRIL